MVKSIKCFLSRNIYKNRKEYWDFESSTLLPYKIALTIYIIKSTRAEVKIITTTLYNKKAFIKILLREFLKIPQSVF